MMNRLSSVGAARVPQVQRQRGLRPAPQPAESPVSREGLWLSEELLRRSHCGQRRHQISFSIINTVLTQAQIVHKKRMNG